MALRLRLVLLPLAALYGLVVWLRNWSFRIGWLKSSRFEVPVISIGNITVGGTGKTPHTEYLAKLLGQYHQAGMVSRGYLRRTKGVVVASEDSTSETIGDEPLQIKQKFPLMHVVVAEKRAEGIKRCLLLQPKPDVVLLDDAHQHRYVQPGLSIVLVDYHRPVWNDFLLPAGNLREGMCGLARAQVVVVTKCPEGLGREEAGAIEKKLKLKSSQQLYFSTFAYGNAYPLLKTGQMSFRANGNCTILAFTAIANAKPFHLHLKTLAKNVVSIELSDHHRFADDDLQQLVKKFNDIESTNKWIAVTEKDAVKLHEMKHLPIEIVSYIGVVPIEPKLLFSQEKTFNTQILEYVGKR